MSKKIWSEQFSEGDIERIIRMGWEDRTSFEDIKAQFKLNANDTIKFMRSFLPRKDFERWRKRTQKWGYLKHEKLRPEEVDRFKCSRQRLDGSTKGWK